MSNPTNRLADAITAEAEPMEWPLEDQASYAAKHAGPSHLGFLDETDIQIAGRVRMLMRDDWLHEAVVMAARDRICRLFVEKQTLIAAADAAERFIAGFEDAEDQQDVADLLAQLRAALASEPAR